jgi:hypothetical protein
MHNTPPPTEFYDGSFEAQLKEELTFHPSGGRWQHRCVPTGATSPFIAHIRILKGNGDTIYLDESAEDSVIRIALENDHTTTSAGDVTITGGPDFFQIDSDSRFGGPNPGPKSRHKYGHPGKGHPFHIKRIVVEKPAGSQKFEVMAPVQFDEEYRIMIWHIGDYVVGGRQGLT